VRVQIPPRPRAGLACLTTFGRLRARPQSLPGGDPPDPHVTGVAVEGDQFALGAFGSFLAVGAGLESGRFGPGAFGSFLAAGAGLESGRFGPDTFGPLVASVGVEGALAGRRGGAGAWPHGW
jgi:hypothetical protein